MHFDEEFSLRHCSVSLRATSAIPFRHQIHAGDFTHFGKKKDVIAVNEWLGTLPHKHKIVVNGNHEKNAEWKKDTAKLLSNCSFFLKDSMVTVKVDILQTEAKDDLSSINLLKVCNTIVMNTGINKK